MAQKLTLHSSDMFFFCLSEVGLKISLHKLRVMQEKFDFLGVQCDATGHSNPTEKLSAFQSWSAPSSLGALNSRLSTLAYYSNYLPYLKKIAIPLLHLAKSDKFIWTKIEAEAWEDLMFTLKFPCTLTTASPEDKLIISTDASSLACGFALLKVSPGLNFHPFWMESRLFTPSERNSPIIHKELLACLLAIRRCETYIRASHHPVILLSDAISISFLKQNRAHHAKLTELSHLMSSLTNLVPVFLSGSWNILADQLSRSVHKAAISEETPDPSVTELSIDLKKALGSKITHLSPAGLHEYLQSDPQGELYDLQYKK